MNANHGSSSNIRRVPDAHPLDAPRFRMPVLSALIALLIHALPAFVTSSGAATYYVATTGNDANPGTAARPFQTIKRGARALAPGDTLRVKSGTYPEASRDLLPSGPSASQPTTLEGEPGSERPVLRPTTPKQGGILIISAARRNLRFRNLVFDARALRKGHSQVLAASGTGITFEDCEAIGSPNMWEYGRVMTVSKDAIVTVRRCVLRGGGSPKTSQGGVGVHGFYWSGCNGLIENCEIYDNDGLGIQLYKTTSTTCVSSNVFRNNYVHHNGKTGIYMARGYDNRVYNNIVAHNRRGVWFTCNRNYLDNNTICNNRTAGVEITGGSGAVRNNIVYANGRNIYQHGGKPAISNNLTTDPGFVNADANDFRLEAGSPAIDAGATLPEMTTDRDGTPRPRGRAFDIGAYEYAGAAAARSAAPSARGYTVDRLLFADDFSDGLENWVVEKAKQAQVRLVDGVVDIRRGRQTSIWYRKPLSERVMIEYRARGLEGDGRPTDLNALWMARDRLSTPPLSLDTFFDTGGRLRFESLAAYYTGLGSNGNQTFRFRRFYDPANLPPQVRELARGRNRVILRDHDSDGQFRNAQGGFMTPGQWYKFTLVYFEGLVEVYIDGVRAFQYREQPWDVPAYDRGYFAFRTTFGSHVQFDDVRISSLRGAR
ncbi:MAG: right-handed parallel beta-helix repeat-containing protein [Kiritimatiellae bacterium]|nr:right-handed parallel beta-helix repeat-containing protein [Kiritimatiellia bacterium]